MSAASDPAGEPRRDFLDQPRVAVGILEGAERTVARALRVAAGLPCLDWERRAVPHVTHVDATADELVMGRLDVGDDQPPSAEPGAAAVIPLPNVTEAREPGGVNCTMRRPSSGP